MAIGRERGKQSLFEVNPFPPLVDIVIATIMILLLLSVLQTLQSMQAEVHEEIDVRQQSLRGLVAEAFPDRWGTSIQDHVDGEEQLFRFSDEILFPTSKATLYPGGVEVLKQFGAILKQHRLEFASIRVEGHTDERPIFYPYRSNWELSTARATAVVHILTDPKFDVSVDPTIVTAAGYGEHHPVARGHNEAAWRLNRRIEIAVRYSPEAVMGQLQAQEDAGRASAN